VLSASGRALLTCVYWVHGEPCS